jgi:hypothetical protein
MFAIYEHANTSAVLTVVAAFDGDSPGVPSDLSFFDNTGAADPYLVVGGATDDWQAIIGIVHLTKDLWIDFAPEGGYSSGDTFGAAVATGQQIWNDGQDPTSSAALYISSSDGDGYDYLCVRLFDAAACEEAFYVGGYIAAKPSANTKPRVSLVGKPYIQQAVTTGSWGYAAVAGANQKSRVPAEYTPITTSLVAAGYACIASVETAIDTTNLPRGKEYSGDYLMFPVWICALAGFTLGHFGPNTMWAIDETRSMAETDNSGTLITFNDLAFRWAP